MSPSLRGPARAHLAAWYVLGLLAILSLKLFYSRAGPDALGFILAPTARLAGALSGTAFEREDGAGWVSHAERVVLGKACAGVNFMIIAMAALYFPFVGRLEGAVRRGGWLGASAALAWLAAIGANSVRIVAAMSLWRMAIYTGPVTPDRVHRAAGTLVYCLTVVVVYLAAARLFDRHGPEPAPSALVPLGWYAALALGVPIAHRVWRDGPPGLAEHVVLVAAVCLVLLTGVLLLRAARRATGINGSGDGGGERPAA